LVGEGLVTVEDVRIAKHVHRDLASLRTSLRVEDCMSRDVVAVQTNTPLADAALLLLGRDFRALPVTSDDEQLVGILTNTDLVERGKLTVRVELLEALDETARAEALKGSGGTTVGEAMTADPVAIGPDEPIERAAVLMLERGVKRLPLVDYGG